jgi:hypothetical protein
MVTDLGEQPQPEIEPAEPPPGGVDAVEDAAFTAVPVVPDLTRIDNPALNDAMPDAITEPDETDQGAASDGASEPQQEAPA